MILYDVHVYDEFMLKEAKLYEMIWMIIVFANLSNRTLQFLQLENFYWYWYHTHSQEGSKGSDEPPLKTYILKLMFCWNCYYIKVRILLWFSVVNLPPGKLLPMGLDMKEQKTIVHPIPVHIIWTKSTALSIFSYGWLKLFVRFYILTYISCWISEYMKL